MALIFFLMSSIRRPSWFLTNSNRSIWYSLSSSAATLKTHPHKHNINRTANEKVRCIYKSTNISIIVVNFNHIILNWEENKTRVFSAGFSLPLKAPMVLIEKTTTLTPINKKSGGVKTMHAERCSPLLRCLDIDVVHDGLDLFCDLLGPDCVLLKLCFHCWLRDTLLRGHNTQVTVTDTAAVACVNLHAMLRGGTEDKIDTCYFLSGKKSKGGETTAAVCVSCIPQPTLVRSQLCVGTATLRFRNDGKWTQTRKKIKIMQQNIVSLGRTITDFDAFCLKRHHWNGCLSSPQYIHSFIHWRLQPFSLHLPKQNLF